MVQKPDWEPIDLSDPQKIRIFTAGALTKFKGFDYLIRAFRDIVDKYPSVQLRIAGDGSERKKLINLVKKLKLSDNVSLIGNFSYEQMKGEYARCNFTICPSIGPESLSRIIFEAFAMKKTVIATNVGGSSELVIQDRTGLLVKPFNKEVMANAILRLIKSPQLTKKLGKNGWLLINNKSTDRLTIRNHICVYNQTKKLFCE